MKPVQTKHIRLRVIIVGSIFSLFFTAIGAKAVYLQIFRGPWLSKKATNQ
jgi:cell division protein FtsI (penicillin-binding protein 3)